MQTLAAPHADYHKQVYMVQVVLRPLWNAAVVAYQHLEDEEGLYEAWRWMEAHAQDWVPLQQPCYMAMLLAVTALHHRPMQGMSCTIGSVALDMHAIQMCSAAGACQLLRLSHCCMVFFLVTAWQDLKMCRGLQCRCDTILHQCHACSANGTS